MPGGTATPWTAPAPATSPASTSSTPPDELGTRVPAVGKRRGRHHPEGVPAGLVGPDRGRVEPRRQPAQGHRLRRARVPTGGFGAAGLVEDPQVRLVDHKIATRRTAKIEPQIRAGHGGASPAEPVADLDLR